jgi:hypothetical protein
MTIWLVASCGSVANRHRCECNLAANSTYCALGRDRLSEGDFPAGCSDKRARPGDDGGGAFEAEAADIGGGDEKTRVG